MKNLLIVAIIFLMAGCSDEMFEKGPEFDLLKSGMKSDQGRKVEREFKMLDLHCSFWYEPAPEGFCPTGIQATIYGEGNCTHLGKSSITEKFCIDENGLPVLIEGYFTAANGDRIYYLEPSRDDVWIDEDGNSCVIITISGGTGRFENVEGEYLNCYLIDWENQTIEADITGTIIY